MPFQPTDELTMRLTVAEWNVIIAQLHEGKYKDMAPLIQKINVQAAQHEANSVAAAQPQVVNGEDTSKPAGQVTGVTVGPSIKPRGDLN